MSDSGLNVPQTRYATSSSGVGTPPDAPDGNTRKGIKGAPRLYHKKSRTGCQRCRSRRVKCDEVHPTCQNCQRYGMPCVYDHRKRDKGLERLESFETRIHDLDASVTSEIGANSTNTLDFSESRQRRLRELKLLQHYSAKTSKTLAGTSAEDFWAITLPSLAIQNDALLYSLLSISALHLAKTEPNDAEAEEIHQNYLDLAIRGHANDIVHASKDNADVMCLTASFLRLGAFVTLQDRPVDPYAPPMQWLRMTHGTGRVFYAVWEWITEDKDSVAMRVLNRQPLLTPFNEALWAESNRDGLQHLLQRTQADVANEPWDSGTIDAYHSTISYIGSIQIAIAAEEAPSDTCRRLIAFPLLIPKRFIDLVEEQQPRALIVLAHYFVFLARFRDHVWWVGDAGRREIRGIQTILPVEWQDQMNWPLQAIEN